MTTSIVFTIIATFTLPLLTILDLEHYQNVHLVLLRVTFTVHFLAAGFLCVYTWVVLEPFRKKRRTTDSRSSLANFLLIKIALISIGLFLAIIFAVLDQDDFDAAGALEWIIAGDFGVYMASFVADFVVMKS